VARTRKPTESSVAARRWRAVGVLTIIGGGLPVLLAAPAGADVVIGVDETVAIAAGRSDTVTFAGNVCSAEFVVVGARGGTGVSPDTFPPADPPGGTTSTAPTTAPPTTAPPTTVDAPGPDRTPGSPGAAGATIVARVATPAGLTLLVGVGTVGEDGTPGKGGSGGSVPEGFTGEGSEGDRGAGGGGAAASVLVQPAGSAAAPTPLLVAAGGSGGDAPGRPGTGGTPGGPTVVAPGTGASVSTSAPSAPFVSITGRACSAVVSTPSVAGGTTLGSVLTATPAVLTLAPGSVVTSTWQRCTTALVCTNRAVPGPTYEVGPEDLGAVIRYVTTVTSPFQPTIVAISNTVAVPAVPPTATQPPSVTGTAVIGGVLTATTGVWTSPAGPPTFSYAWQRCLNGTCVTIPGATSATYLVTAGDETATIRVAVTASAPGQGAPVTVFSAPVGPVPSVGGVSLERAGYRLLDASGEIYGFGQASGMSNVFVAPGDALIDIAHGPGGTGAFVLSRNGVVTPRGDNVADYGQAAPMLLRGETAASISRTPSGRGYWVFTSRGRALPFGDAVSFGDLRTITLNGPIVDSITTPSGRGYYMVAADGGVFAFGDAAFEGSMGGRRLNKPVVGVVADPDGSGYWLVAADGGVFAFDAEFQGSMGARTLNKPVVGMVAYGSGYLMVAEDGGVFTFSNLPFSGSLGGNPPTRPVVGIAAL
jgi:hypothetical protein